MDILCGRYWAWCWSMRETEGQRPTKPGHCLWHSISWSAPWVCWGCKSIRHKNSLNYRQTVEENSVLPRFYLGVRISHVGATREGRKDTWRLWELQFNKFHIVYLLYRLSNVGFYLFVVKILGYHVSRKMYKKKSILRHSLVESYKQPSIQRPNSWRKKKMDVQLWRKEKNKFLAHHRYLANIS